LFNLNAAMSPPKPLHCAELEAIRRSFGKLSFDLSTFSYGLAKQLGQFVPGHAREDRLRELLHQLDDQTYDGPEILSE
jgi:hypothetical protein